MSFRNFADFTTEDFVENEYFRKSILNPDSESVHYWQQFQEEFPHKQEAILEAKRILLNLSKHYNKKIRQYSKGRAEASFRQLEKMMESPAPIKKISRTRWMGWVAACGLLLLIGISAFLLQQEPTKLSYTTGNGDRLTLQLPDSSEVQLNANSKIHFFPKQWKKEGQREVWLDGEAFFQVQKKTSGIKFLVHAGDMNISVLGTQFNVRSRGKESTIMLVEGQVELAVAEQEIMMKPGDLISYSENKTEVEVKQVESEEYVAWKDGITVFNDALSEVVKELEILYGVKFVIENENLKNRLIQLTAPTDGLDEVLETLELLYPEDISIKEEDGTVIIF